jgi:predicted ATPase
MKSTKKFEPKNLKPVEALGWKITSEDPLHELLEDLAAYNSLWANPEFPLKPNIVKAHPKVLFVAGENCSGKSYFVESLRSWVKAFIEKGTTISVSIRERTGAGLSDGSGMRRTMMFGDESQQSTGATSVGVIGRAFHNLVNRAEDGYRTFMVLDEPEIGLSESYTAAMGTWLGEQIAKMPAKTAGVVIVSHSRALAKNLQLVIGTPSFVHMGKAVSFDDWVQHKECHSVEQLLALQETGYSLRSAIREHEHKLQASVQGR